MTTTPSGTPITAEHIGYRVRCPECGEVGEIDDVVTDGRVVVRHGAVTWHTIAAEATLSLELWGAKP